MRIFLADLGHNTVTVSSDVYPLGVANLAAYLSKYLRTPEAVDVSIFREPENLHDALKKESPDILGLSSYAWNHTLALTFAQYVKATNPETLTLMGGPNFPLPVDEQEAFLRGMPGIDVAVRGPTYEGEGALLALVQRFVDVGERRDGLWEEPVPGNAWIDPRTGDFVRGGEIERIEDLDKIPSPYLNGSLDGFLSTGYFPLLQISRGCPFSCTFCNSSPASNSRVHRHSVENVRADLLYLAERVKPEVTLCFADDNFGMYPWDEEVADYVSFLQGRFGWPRYIRTTTGKNNTQRILRVMKKVNGCLPMTSAVQSLDPDVLRNIERSNIKLETYQEVQRELLEQGMQSYGELILCLPGESKATFLKGVKNLLDAGVKRISAHQLMLLHGAPLNTQESRRQFGFRTRFRVVARNIGEYAGQRVVETEEIVVETPTFTFDDYLSTRIFHLLLTIYYYEGNFEEAFELARQNGISVSDLIVRLQGMLDSAPDEFQQLMQDFLHESEEELFDTEQDCVQWAEEHYDGIIAGTVGGNLLSKYSMMARFCLTKPSIEFLRRGLLETPTVSADASATTSVFDYLGHVMLGVPFADSLSMASRWTARFDVDAWRKDGYGRRLTDYRFPEPRDLTASVSPAQRDLLMNRIGTFGEHPAGLGKFTRTVFATDLRRSVTAAAEVEKVASEQRP